MFRNVLACGLVLAAGQILAQEPRMAEGPVFMALGGGMGAQSFLGVGVAEVDANRARDLKLSEVHGVEITRVDEDSSAAKAGLRTGDVVLEYNGQRVEGSEQFIRMVRETPVGRDVKLVVSRYGATQTIAATMGSRKATVLLSRGGEGWMDLPEIRIPEMPHMFTAWSSATLGIEAESLTSQLAGYFGVKEGVLVRAVVKGSAADQAGIRAGDVILKVDQTAVTTPGEVTNAVRSARSKKTFAVDLMRDKRETSVTVTLSEPPEPGPRPRARAVKM